MTSKQPEPKLAKIKINAKPIKMLPKISLLNKDKKPRMTRVTALWPEKDEENDGQPESGTGQ
jgi:hypothetical protein